MKGYEEDDAVMERRQGQQDHNRQTKHSLVKEAVDEGQPLAWESRRCIPITPAPCLNFFKFLQKAELFIEVEE